MVLMKCKGAKQPEINDIITCLKRTVAMN